MAEKSYFWSGTTIGDAGGYSDGSFRNFIKAVTGLKNFSSSQGIIPKSGSSPSSEPLFATQSPIPSASVSVSIGEAFVNGAWYVNDSPKTLTIEPNISGNDRIDLVVLRFDVNEQTVRLSVIKGAPDPSPTQPVIVQNTSIWDLKICSVLVVNGFSSIVDANITDERVFYLSRTDQGGTGQNSYTAGDILYANAPNTLAKLGIGANSQILTVVADTPAWAAPVSGVSMAMLQYQEPQNTTGTSYTSGDWRTLTLNSKPYDPDNIVTLASNVLTVGAGRYLFYAQTALLTNGWLGHIRVHDTATDIELGRFSTYNQSNTVERRVFTVLGVGDFSATTTVEFQVRVTGTMMTHVQGNAFGVEPYTQAIVLKI